MKLGDKYCVKAIIFSLGMFKNDFELMVKTGFWPLGAPTASPKSFGWPIFSFFD